MAATRNLEAYSGSGSLTCSLPSLASGSSQESNVQSNTSNLNFEEQVAVTFTIASGSPSTSSPYVNVYVAGSIDGAVFPIIQKSNGATYQTGGGNSTVGALGTPSNLNLIGVFGIQTTTSTAERTFRTQPYSISQAFNGVVPAAYSVIVENQTGVSFSSSTTSTAQLVERNGIYTTSGN